MAKPKPSYEDRVIPTSFGIKRGLLEAFTEKVEELNLNKSVVVSSLITDFLYGKQ